FDVFSAIQGEPRRSSRLWRCFSRPRRHCVPRELFALAPRLRRRPRRGPPRRIASCQRKTLLASIFLQYCQKGAVLSSDNTFLRYSPDLHYAGTRPTFCSELALVLLR